MLAAFPNSRKDRYRFTFQGQEADDEIKGQGNSINYKYRMHDPRLGRFFAVDPLSAKFPWNSTYAFSENKVIHMVELEGLESAPTQDKKAEIPSAGVDKEGNTHSGIGDMFGKPEYNGVSNTTGGKKSASTQNSSTSSATDIKSSAFTLTIPKVSAASPSYTLGAEYFSSKSSSKPQLSLNGESYSTASNYLTVFGGMMKGTEYALRSSAANTQFKYAQRTASGVISAAKATNQAKIALQNVANIAKGLGTTAGVFGVFTTTFSAAADGNYTLGDFSKTTIAGISVAFPVVGIIDLGIQWTTGTSGSDRIGKWIDDQTGDYGYEF